MVVLQPSMSGSRTVTSVLWNFRLSKKSLEAIKKWIKPIRNHLWYPAENCSSDIQELKVQFIRLFYYVIVARVLDFSLFLGNSVNSIISLF